MTQKPATVLCSLGLLTFGWLATSACRTVQEPAATPARVQGVALSEPQYELRLHCAPAALVLGEKVRCTLTIAEAGTEPVNPGFEDAALLLGRPVASKGIDGNSQAGFQRSFHRQPEAVGPYVIEPFELSFEGQQLVSNSAEVAVLASPPADLPVSLVVSKPPLRAGVPFELFLSQTSDIVQRLTLEGNDELELRSVSTRTQAVNGVTSYSAIYRAVAHRPGRLILDRSFYRGLPEDVDVPALVLEIVPPRTVEPY